MMHHIYRRCLTYPADSELLSRGKGSYNLNYTIRYNYKSYMPSRDPTKDKENDCIGLGPGKTGEDCYSVCFENDCNSALVFEFTSELFAFLFVTMF